MTETMSPADEVRAAASIVRHHATRRGVPIGPWRVLPERNEVVASDDSLVFATGGSWRAQYRTAQHLMQWTPQVALALADWLDEVGDEMADDHAYVMDHPEWIGLAEDLRWGVHAKYGPVKADNRARKAALIAARAINGGPA